MPNYNRLTIIGHLGRDPEARTTAAGTTFCVFPLAVTEYQKKKDGEGFNELTTWFDCTCWDKYIAEKITRADLKKGAAVMLVGPVSCRAFAAKDGSPRAMLAINVKEFTSLDRKPSAQSAYANTTASEAQQPSNGTAGTQTAMQNAYEAGADDDLPF